MTASSGGFELRGGDDDETRLLVHPEVGYSLAVPGRPRPIAMAAPRPGYDVVVQLTDAPIEIGLRIDRLTAAEANMPPAVLVSAMTNAYVTSRADQPTGVTVDELDHKTLAAGADSGLRSNYRLRGDDAEAMEFLMVQLRGTHIVYVTARYRRSDITPFAWSNVRSVLHHHQSFTPGELPSVPVWPVAPRLLAPTIAFQLTESAMREAQAKADELGVVSQDEVDRIADVLLASINTDDPPTTPWHPFLNQMAARRVASAVPSRIAEILLRDIDAVNSMHDYRGWCWECFWAVGNRAELRSRTTN